MWDGSFNVLTLRGGAAAILWGYRTAAALRAWKIQKLGDSWSLVATIERVDAFASRQGPLLFSAPRAGGFWCWPIQSLQVGETKLTARLGPPEQ